MNESDYTWVVSYGGGTNSAAVLIGMRNLGITPALTMFADTGNEKPHTYAHIEVMQEWCKKNGFPPITIVRNEFPQGLIDKTLYHECLRLGTLPSKVFGRSSCSMKWKVEPQYRYLKRWMAERGVERILQVVGIDMDELHRLEKRGKSWEFALNRFLLLEWGWGRDECIQAIDREGLPRPGKSACFMCPSSKKPEVMSMKNEYPLLYRDAITLERGALASGKVEVVGLGRHWNWETFAGSDIAVPEVDCGCYDGSPE